MTSQNVYEAENLDFERTYENLASKLPGVIRESAGRVLGGVPDVGAISFKLLGTDIKVLIFPKGPPHKIQVAWTDTKEKEQYWPKLLSLLVPLPRKEVEVTPLFANITARVNFPFSNPLTLEVPWCDKKFHYARADTDHLPKDMRELWELDVKLYEILLRMEHKIKEDASLFGSPLVLISKAS